MSTTRVWTDSSFSWVTTLTTSEFVCQDLGPSIIFYPLAPAQGQWGQLQPIPALLGPVTPNPCTSVIVSKWHRKVLGEAAPKIVTIPLQLASSEHYDDADSSIKIEYFYQNFWKTLKSLCVCERVACWMSWHEKWYRFHRPPCNYPSDDLQMGNLMFVPLGDPGWTKSWPLMRQHVVKVVKD